MRRVLLLAAIVPSLALAQVPEDAMEVQRCIWRCQAEHGAGNTGYNACIAQYCDEGGSDPQASPPVSPPVQSPFSGPAHPQTTLAAGPGVLAGVWTFGTHPDLGPAAYITTAAGTVGVGCGIGGAAVGLRFSNSFMAQGPVTLMTDPLLFASSYPRLQGDWSGADSDVCTGAVDELATGAALYLLPAKIDALSADAGGMRVILSAAGRTADVGTAADALAAFGGYVVPLTGAHQALGALLQSCPKAQQDMEYGCGD
jgi:hypothetical protein